MTLALYNYLYVVENAVAVLQNSPLFVPPGVFSSFVLRVGTTVPRHELRRESK